MHPLHGYSHNIGGLKLEMRMVTHFLPLLSCEVLKQPSCCESRKWVTILISNLRPPNIMAVSMEEMHEGLGTSPNSC